MNVCIWSQYETHTDPLLTFLWEIAGQQDVPRVHHLEADEAD